MTVLDDLRAVIDEVVALDADAFADGESVTALHRQLARLEAVTDARTHRRAMLNKVLDSWSLEERQQFLESLTRFNADIELLAAQPVS